MIRYLQQILNSERTLPEEATQKILTPSSSSGLFTEPAPLPPSAQYDDPEYTVLSQKFGVLETGRTIEATLSDLLSILPRRRPRIEAYGSLVKKLAADGITLKISSRRTKND